MADFEQRRYVTRSGVTLVADGHSTTDNEYLLALQTIAYHNALLDEFGACDGFGNGERCITVKPAHAVTFGH